MGRQDICASGKLPQEAHIILKEELYIIDSVFELRKAVDSQAESVARDALRIVIHKPIDGRIDHARAEELDPSRIFTKPATAAPADEAGRIDFDGRFGEREIARAQARFSGGPKEFAHEILDCALEFAEGDVRINRETFYLVEHVGVGRVWIITAVDLSRHDDAYGRLLLLHRVNLHGRGVRAQQMRLRSRWKIEIERIHHVARRVMFRDIQRLEIVIRRLDLPAFHDGK